MLNSHRITGIVLILSAAVLCAGCASGSSFRAPVQLISNADIIIVRANAHFKLNGVVVAGDVRRPNLYAGVVPGYLQIIGRDTVGHVIATATAPWGDFNSWRFRLAYFRAFLRTTNPAAISAISVEPITGRRP